jgi:hypothetical protein
MFPKRPTKAQRAEGKELQEEHKRLHALPEGKERSIQLAQLEQRCVLLAGKIKGGLRVDSHLVDPHRNGRDSERIVDVTAFHTTCQSRIKREYKHTLACIAAAKEAKAAGSKDKLRFVSSPSVTEERAAKHKHYAPLIDLMHKQKSNRMRDHVPRFVAACMTTHGEFGKETTALIEWVTAAYGRLLDREGDDDDGIRRVLKTARFRSDMRRAMLFAVAFGQARMLLECGLSRAMCHYGRHRAISRKAWSAVGECGNTGSESQQQQQWRRQ